MNPVLKFAKTMYVTTQNLKPLLREYVNIDDYIARMVKRKELIRLKNGFFLIAEKMNEEPIPYEQIANLLYGPSYLSFEWALSYYKMIPEGVYVPTSATVLRSKSFQTVIGTFDYITLSHCRYAIGIEQQENSSGRFLIATPEKALCDSIQAKSASLDGSDLLADLVDARRIDVDILKNLNIRHLHEIAEQYHSKTITNLIKVIIAL